jgi:hypothetical protein
MLEPVQHPSSPNGDELDHGVAMLSRRNSDSARYRSEGRTLWASKSLDLTAVRRSLSDQYKESDQPMPEIVESVATFLTSQSEPHNRPRREQLCSYGVVVDEPTLPSLPTFGAVSPSSLGRTSLLLPHVQIGLNVASVGVACLSTAYDLFHVVVFLDAYQLPLPTYRTGLLLYVTINTTNYVCGAWIIDHLAAHHMTRCDLIALVGCLYAVCFLTPFFRWPSNELDDESHTVWSWEGLHFVLSLSLYDAMSTVTLMLMGSVVTDCHDMTDEERVNYLSSGKVASLIASAITARSGLALYDSDHLYPFRLYVAGLAVVVATMFVAGQILILQPSSQSVFRSLRNLCSGRRRLTMGRILSCCCWPVSTKRPLRSPKLPNSSRSWKWVTVIRDFATHRNFVVWMVMEMLLEAQTAYVSAFQKTFMDHLVLQPEDEVAGFGMSGSYYTRDHCDMLLSIVRPLTMVISIAMYVPIRRLGYSRIYLGLFLFNFVFSGIMCFAASPSSTHAIATYLVVYPVLAGAVQASGFHLAMSDLVLEMKRRHIGSGRLDEPSRAALFMGTNALFCKPMGAFLPIVTATLLDHATQQESRTYLYHLLVVPPLWASLVQALVWWHFDLVPRRTAKMRDELMKMHSAVELQKLEFSESAG